MKVPLRWRIETALAATWRLNSRIITVEEDTWYRRSSYKYCLAMDNCSQKVEVAMSSTLTAFGRNCQIPSSFETLHGL